MTRSLMCVGPLAVGAVLVLAATASGSWMTRGHVVFADGTEAGLTHLFACNRRGG